jgi:hypothetical protein
MYHTPAARVSGRGFLAVPPHKLSRRLAFDIVVAICFAHPRRALSLGLNRE